METEYRYLLHLLGAYLHQIEPEHAEAVDWNQLLQLAQIHGVTGIVGYMSMKYPICPDAQMKASLRSLCLNTIARFTQRGAAADEMMEALSKVRIDHIFMKGYVLRHFYPVPELRTFNDIDLVIRAEDRQKCDALMTEWGFQRHTDWEPVYSYVRGSEFYEIHTDIMEVDVSDKADYKGYFRNMWEHTELKAEYSHCFTPEYHFLYLLTHIAKHVHGSGAGIRMYLDVAVFIQHYADTIDWEWIRKELEQLQLLQFASTAMTAVKQWFTIACPMRHEEVPAAVMDQFLTFTMEAGTFGHYERSSAVTALKHAEQADSASRLHRILEKTFPKAETIQKRYTYLQEKPWLLPAAWIHRLVKNREKLGRRVQEMQDLLDADTEEVLQMQKLMRNIGL